MQYLTKTKQFYKERELYIDLKKVFKTNIFLNHVLKVAKISETYKI